MSGVFRPPAPVGEVAAQLTKPFEVQELLAVLHAYGSTTEHLPER